MGRLYLVGILFILLIIMLFMIYFSEQQEEHINEVRLKRNASIVMMLWLVVAVAYVWLYL